MKTARLAATALAFAFLAGGLAGLQPAAPAAPSTAEAGSSEPFATALPSAEGADPSPIPPAASAGVHAARFESHAGGYRIVSDVEGTVDAHGIQLDTPQGPIHIRFPTVGGAPFTLETLPGVSNYYIGNDPSLWRTDVPRASRIVVPDVAPGVDVEAYFVDGVLEFDFVLSPGADRQDARFTVSGAAPALLGTGDLQVGPLVLPKPVAFQSDAIVDAWFEVDGRRVTVAVADHDPQELLRIDPKIQWATFHGGTSSDYPTAVATWDGDVYIGGYTCSSPDSTPPYTGFPIKNAFDGTFTSCYEPYIARIDGDDGSLVWSTYFAGSVGIYWDYLSDLAVNEKGLVAVGSTESLDFPTTPNAYQPSRGGGSTYTMDAWAARFSHNGGLLYSTYLGGDAVDNGLAAGAVGDRIYIAGNSDPGAVTAVRFPTTSDAYRPDPDDSYSTYADELVFAVLDPTLSGSSQLVYSTFFGAPGYDYASEMHVSPRGVATIAATHYTSGSTGDIPTQGANGTAPYQSTSIGTYRDHPYLVRFDPSQSGAAGLVYSTYVRGTSSDEAVGVVVNDAGEAYIAGFGSSSTVVTVTGLTGWDMTRSGYEPWIVAMDVNGSTPIAGTYYGATGTDRAFALAMGEDNRPVLATISLRATTGPSSGYSEDSPWRTQPWQNLGSYDIIVARFDPTLKERDFHFVTGSTSSEPYSWVSYRGMYNDVAVMDDGYPVLHYVSSNANAAVSSNAYDTSHSGYEGVVTRLGYLPPVPILTATNDVVSGRLETEGTLNDEVQTFRGEKVNRWEPAGANTSTVFTIDRNASMAGDTGPAGNIKWDWDLDGDLDFKDGVPRTTQFVQLTGGIPGDRTVCLRGTDPLGQTASTCIVVRFENALPFAIMKSDPSGDSLPVCTPVRLDGSDSYDTDSGVTPGIQDYLWDFNVEAGESVDAEGPVVDLVVDEVSQRLVRLTVTDLSGEPGSVEKVYNFTGRGLSALDDAYSVKAGRRLLVNDALQGVVGNDCYMAGGAPEARLLDPLPDGLQSLYLQKDGTFAVRADASAAGTASVRYELRDVWGQRDVATINFTILPWNEPPVAADDQHVWVDEDTPTSFTLQASDPDGDFLIVTFAGETIPGNGLDRTYTPPRDACHMFDESQAFSYSVRDPVGLTDTGTVHIHIDCLDDAPTAVTDRIAVEAYPAPPQTRDLVANDLDVDGDVDLELVFVGPPPPDRGFTERVDTRQASFEPPATRGFANFTYAIEDPTGLTGYGDVIVWVYEPGKNQPPVAFETRVEATRGEWVTFPFQVLDDDPLWALTYQATSATGAQIEFVDGEARYRNDGACGIQDRFPYTVTDPSGASATGQAVVVVVCPNRAPVAVDDEFTVFEDESTILEVRANDHDADGHVLLVTAFQGDGTAAIQDGELYWAPPKDQSGTFNLTYTVSDAYATDTATVTVHVLPVPDAPVAVDDTAEVEAGSSVLIPVLANDHDPDGDAIALVSASDGVLEGDAVRFEVPPGAGGTTSFTYIVTDGTRDSTGVVHVDIGGVNRWPEASSDSYLVEGELAVPAPGLLVNDIDADGDDLTPLLLSAPRHGEVTLSADGSFTYVPDAGFTGTDHFRYAADDGEAASAATVTLTVRAPAEAYAPQQEPVGPGTAEGPIEQVQYDLRVREGDAVALQPTGPWRQIDGPFVVVQDGAFTAPALDGPQVLVFELAGMRATVHVSPGNTPPTVRLHDQTVLEGDEVSLVADAEDADGDRLTYTWRQVEGPTVSLSSIASRVPTFMAEAGQYVFEVTVTDGIDSVVARVTVTAQTVPEAVVAFDALPVPAGWWFTAVHRDGQTYTWDLGDGATAAGRDVVHGYDGPGPHTVRLTVTDALGNKHMAEKTVGADQPVPDEVPMSAEKTQDARSDRPAWIWILAAVSTLSVIGTGILLGRRH